MRFVSGMVSVALATYGVSSSSEVFSAPLPAYRREEEMFAPVVTHALPSLQGGAYARAHAYWYDVKSERVIFALPSEDNEMLEVLRERVPPPLSHYIPRGKGFFPPRSKRYRIDVHRAVWL